MSTLTTPGGKSEQTGPEDLDQALGAIPDPVGSAAQDPTAAINALADSEQPYLIGVRHHSPAMAVAMVELLNAYEPDVLAIELPKEAADWLDWLTDPAAVAPLALAFTTGTDLSFYPFADFSPELVALRWARAHQVPVQCIDLAVGHRPALELGASHEGVGAQPAEDPTQRPGGLDPAPEEGQKASVPPTVGEVWWVEALASTARAEPGDLNEIWDRIVEAPAIGSTAEQVRRAGLAHGWASRRAEGHLDPTTLAREQAMGAAISQELAAGKKVAAIVGAFHAPAFAHLDRGTSQLVPEVLVTDPDSASTVTGCLVGYTFDQLDSRSGYPAGIRDPGWQQAVFDAAGSPSHLAAETIRIVTEITRQLRSAGHPAGPGEAAETVRVASDLAALRGLGAPARRELIEAVTSVLAHGDVLGRGRAVANALESVLVGKRSGRVAPGNPVSALRANLIGELDTLGLPTTADPSEVRVEPLRGPRELARHVLLRRLAVGQISYAYRKPGRAWRGADTVASSWQVQWTSATDASVELAGARGLTAEQVATTQLLARSPGNLAEATRWLVDAADCGSALATRRALRSLAQNAASSDFASCVQLAAVLDDIATMRIPGARLLPAPVRGWAQRLTAEFTSAAIRELPGVAGSDHLDDARALAAFVAQASDRELGVRHALGQILANGSPLMQGAAAGLLAEHRPAAHQRAPDDLLASWLHATTADQRHRLHRRLAGLLITTVGQFDTALGAFSTHVNELDDAHFVSILPALRGGCDVLEDDARHDLLDDLASQFGSARDLVLTPSDTLATASYDAAARERLTALGLADLQFSPAERWRLILGQQRPELSTRGRRLASALDELYGRPGSDALDPGMRGAGAGPSQLGVREWAGEIEALFGDVTLTEVFGQAAAQGRADVLEHLDPARVRPSVELLTTALALTGALPEARLAKLRPLIARLVDALTAELANRLRPNVSGLNTNRPTRRRTARLQLDRTIRANLRHIVFHNGRHQVVPVTPIFAQRASREADWHLIVLVDVSASMSESVVFSALTAAVLTGVRCLEVTFLAFSTEVIDYSGQVSDPLALLLEVDIGGGTNIAGALRVARSRVRVPERTMCVLVSDFDQYGSLAPLLSEVSELHASGVKLLGCAALNDSGTAVYNVGIAAQVAAAGMRVAALSPQDLARWVGKVIRA